MRTGQLAFVWSKQKPDVSKLSMGRMELQLRRKWIPTRSRRRSAHLRTLLGDSGSFVAKMNEHAVNTTKNAVQQIWITGLQEHVTIFVFVLFLFHGLYPRKCVLFVSQPCMQLFRIETFCCFNLPTFRWWKLMYPR